MCEGMDGKAVREGVDGKVARTCFGGDGNVLYHDCSGGFLGAYSNQNSSN